LENLKGRDNSEEVVVDGRIILEWILGTLIGKLWTGLIWLRIRIRIRGWALVNTVMYLRVP
jgi:hypothetical protein